MVGTGDPTNANKLRGWLARRLECPSASSYNCGFWWSQLPGFQQLSCIGELCGSQEATVNAITFVHSAKSSSVDPSQFHRQGRYSISGSLWRRLPVLRSFIRSVVQLTLQVGYLSAFLQERIRNRKEKHVQPVYKLPYPP
jgi:hypothetical protein